ncbi:MAG: Xaa-Pro peptidase family protein [Minwuia sp.]|nr:Xaa-Pro peptidase family protein [Minwuia sp.]
MTEQDFPPEEFAERLERAQRAMRNVQIDALLLTTEADVRYFTGFRTLFWQSPTRPWFLIVPANDRPIAIIPEIGAALMAATWVDDIRSWSSPHATDDGIGMLADALRPFSRVGMPMGRESSLRMPLIDLKRLESALDTVELLDCTPLMRDLRVVKSEREIAILRAICGIASDAFDHAPDLFHIGQPLSEAFRAFRIDLLRCGADDVPYLVGGAGQGGYPDVISPPGPTPLLAGDVLMLDTGATLQGYHCDFDRNYAFDHADDAARAAYRTLHRATDAALAIARPGVTCAELHAAMQAVIGQDTGDVGRYGHGLGMQLTEHPSIIGFDQTVMQPGMVMTLEPSMQIAEGRIMAHEENMVIRDGAPELLSRRASPELPIIGGGA